MSIKQHHSERCTEVHKPSNLQLTCSGRGGRIRQIAQRSSGSSGSRINRSGVKSALLELHAGGLNI